MHVAIALLMSGTMHFKNKKIDAIHIATHLGLEAIKLAHPLTPIMISPSTTLLLPSSKKPHAMDYFLKQISHLPGIKSPLDMKKASHTITSHLKKRSLLIMIGDFLEEIDLTQLSKRHSLFLIIVRDSFEEDPYPLGEGDFSDLESSEQASFYFGTKAVRAYKEKYQEHDAKLFSHLRKLGIPYQKVIDSNLHIS